MVYGTLLEPERRGDRSSFGYLVGLVNGILLAILATYGSRRNQLFSAVNHEAVNSTVKQDGTFPVESMIHEPPLPPSSADLQAAVDGAVVAREVVKRVQPSIVTIMSVSEVVTPPVEMMGVVLMNETVQNQSALGTGVVMMVDGKQIIMTAAHVVADAHTIMIQDANKDIWNARTTMFNAPHDLASIELTNRTANGTPVQLAYNGAISGLDMTVPGQMNTGDTVMAFGNNMGLGLAVTAGIISAIGKQVVLLSDNSTIQLPIFQTDASINHGNSGGALIDASSGKVCGITNSIISNNGGNIGIGFAITSNTVRKFLKNELKNGELMPTPEEPEDGGSGYTSTLSASPKAATNERVTPVGVVPRTTFLSKDDGFSLW